MNRKKQSLSTVISLLILFAFALGGWAVMDAQAVTNAQADTDGRSATEDVSLKPKGPYLGQEPPGDIPVPFANDFLGVDLHSGPVFSRNGKEVFWSRLDGSTGHILTSHWTDKGWSAPREVRFASGSTDSGKEAYHQRSYCMPSGEPCLSPDGTRLFFIAQETAENDYRELLWVAAREGQGWGEPRRINPLIDAMDVHWQISVAENGNLYFNAKAVGGGDLFVSECIDGSYRKPVSLGSAINSDHGEACPFIAPDESYLIFTRIDRSSTRKAELYISFRTSGGKWIEAKSMDKLNKDRVNDLCATVSRDHRYLFFLRNTRHGLSPHWVDARVIDEYR